MSTTAELPSRSTPRSLVVGDLIRSVDRFRAAVWIIVAAQAVWLGVLMSRGWYYQADLANLAEATGRPLDWAYLSGAQGGHFAVPARFVFWVLNRAAPLNYGWTIAIRLAGQALATLLLARLLVLLAGHRRTVLVALALYSFSPFLLQATLWVSASIGLLGSQLLLLGAITNHVRYVLTGRVRYAVATSAFALAATLLSEQAAVTVLILPILSLFFLITGSARDRVIATLAGWREWALIIVPMLAYVAYYFSGGASYGTAAHPLGLTHAVDVIGVELGQTVAPGVLGGPWRWFASGDNYLGLSTPSALTEALCIVGALALVAYCVRLQGLRALAAWSMPVVVSAVGIVVVAIGRFDAFGIVIAQQFEHPYCAAAPAAVAVCLAVCGVDPAAVRGRLRRELVPIAPVPRLERRPARTVAFVLVPVLLASSIFSGITYGQVWSRNPAHDYVSALDQSLRATGAPTALYDTAVPSGLIPLEARHYVSDVVGLTGARADFSATGQRPKIVDSSGHPVAASFYVQTAVDLTGSSFCKFPVQGAVTTTRPFRQTPRRNDWYLELSYFEQHASVIDVRVLERDGTIRRPVRSAQVVLHGGVGGIHLLFKGSAPAAVRVSAKSPATNLCITSVQIGFPYAAKAS